MKFERAVRPMLLWIILLAGVAIAGGAAFSRASDSSTTVAAAAPPSAAETTPTKADLVRPEELVKLMALPEAKRPVLLHVGFSVLYKSGHLAGSKFIGSGSTPSGRAALKKTLEAMPKDQAVVLYCGCCPWVHCPNVNPAFRVARATGRKNVKILYIVEDLEHDWVGKGYPALVQ